MNLLLAFAACGLAGAFTYSFPVYIKAISTQPPLKFALVNLIFSVFVGSLSAAIFTQAIGYHWPWTVKPQPWPLATVIGLSSNPLVPVLVRRLEAWIQNFQGPQK